MKSSTWSDELLDEHRDYIRENGARAAFNLLVAAAVKSPVLACAPATQGEARIFTYTDEVSGARPFAFIVNQRSLLFYVRRPGLSAVPKGLKTLRAAFDAVSENSLGEWTVSIETADQARRLHSMLFSPVEPRPVTKGGIPDVIARSDVLHAMERIDAGVAHRFGESLKYDLIYERRRYAPQAVVGLAAARLASRVLGPADFSGGQDSKAVKILQDLGFEVGPKDPRSAASSEKSFRTDPAAAGKAFESIIGWLPVSLRSLAIASLRHSIDYATEHHPDRWILTLHPGYMRFIAGMVQCLQYRKDGGASILLVRKAVPRELRRGGTEYKNAPGCLEVYPSLIDLVTRYDELRLSHEDAIRICAEQRPVSSSHRRGHAPGLLSYLESLDLTPVKIVPVDQVDDQDYTAIADRAIFARTDIGPTQKQTLVDARRGQGLFRERVIALESRCRITGVENAVHLRASHIKPWKVASDQERLDGNNGLLIAPHIDHLFDQGFISFTDFGDLIVSPQCPETVLVAWGILRTLNVGPFRVQQRAYLAYHRAKVLQK